MWLLLDPQLQRLLSIRCMTMLHLILSCMVLRLNTTIVMLKVTLFLTSLNELSFNVFSRMLNVLVTDFRHWTVGCCFGLNDDFDNMDNPTRFAWISTRKSWILNPEKLMDINIRVLNYYYYYYYYYHHHHHQLGVLISSNIYLNLCLLVVLIAK